MSFVPKLPLHRRAKSAAGTTKNSRGSMSSREENAVKIARAKSVISSRQKVPTAKIPLSARVNNSKPHTPTGRPEQRRMHSARVREDQKETIPPAPTSPTRKGWALVREKVNLPRSTGFAPARRSNVTLSDAVRRGANEVVHLKDKVNRLRNELNEKDQRLASAKKSSNSRKETGAAAPPSQEKIYVRDEVAIRTAEKEKEAAIAELKVFQAKYRTLKTRNQQNETMLASRIEKINQMDNDRLLQTNQHTKQHETYRQELQAKDQSILLLREELEKNRTRAAAAAAAAATTTTASTRAPLSAHHVAAHVEAQALRIQVAKLVKELHEQKQEKLTMAQDHLILNKKEKLSEVLKIKNANELKEQMLVMKKALGVQKRRILELESKMKLKVQNNSNMHVSTVNNEAVEIATLKHNIVKITSKATKKYKQLESKYQQLESKYQQLESKYQQLESKDTQLHKDHQSQQQQQALDTTALNNIILGLKEQVHTTQQSLKQHVKQHAIVLNDAKQKDIEIAELKQKIVALHEEHDLVFEARNNNSATLLAAEQNIIQQLQAQIKTHDMKMQQSALMKKELESLQQKMKACDLKYRSEQSNYQVLDKKYKQLVDTNKASSNIIGRLQQELASVKTRQIEEKKQLVEDQVSKIQQIEETYKLKREALQQKQQEEQAKEWEKAHRSAAIESNQAKTMMAAATAREHACEKELKQLRDQIIVLKEEITCLKQLLELEKEKYQTSLVTFNEMKNELTLLLHVANERSASLEEHSKALQLLADTNQERLQHTINELTLKLQQWHRTGKEHAAAIKLKNKEIKHLKTSGHAEDEASKACIATLQQEILSLQQQLKAWATKDKSYELLQTQLLTLQKNIDDNYKKVDTTKQEMKDLQASHFNELAQLTQAHATYVLELKKEHALALAHLQRGKEQANANAKGIVQGEKELHKCQKELARQKNQLVLLKQEHLNGTKVLEDRIFELEQSIVKLNQEIAKLKKTMAKNISDKLAEKLADKAESMDVETSKLKKDIAHHKRTIKEQIARLKKVREELKTSQEQHTRETRTSSETIQKLKSMVVKLKKEDKDHKKNQQDQQQDQHKEEQHIAHAMEMIEKLKTICSELSAAVVAETKSSGYLSNLNVLIKTAEVSSCEKKSQQLKKELSNNKKIHSVLMYNIKYGEKIVAKFDANAAKKQTKARTDSLRKLEQDIKESRTKEKRFQETSDNNVDELEALKKGAKEKLIGARKNRKKFTSDMNRAIEEAINLLKKEE